MVAASTFSFPATAPYLAWARDAIVTFASQYGVPDSVIADIKIAVTEAATNVVLGASEAEPGVMGFTVSLTPMADSLEVVVADNAPSALARVDRPGRSLAMPIIFAVTERVSVRSAPNGVGTEICMTFGLSDDRGGGRAWRSG